MIVASVVVSNATLAQVIMGISGVEWLARQPDTVFPILLVLIGIVGLIPLIVIWRRPGWDLFEPILVYSLLSFPGLIALYNEYYLLPDTFARGGEIRFGYTEGMTIVAVLNFLLILFTVVGYYLRFDWYDSALVGLFPDSDSQMIKTTRAFAALLMLIGVASYVVILFATPLHTNPFYLYQNTVPRSQIFADVNFLIKFTQYMYIGLFLWITATVANGHASSARHVVPLLTIAGALVLLGGRARVIKVLLIFIIFTYYVIIRRIINAEARYLRLKRDRIHRVLKEATIPAVGVLFIFGVIILGALRRGQADGVQEVVSSIDLIRILTLGNADGASNEVLLILIENVPSEFGYYYGASYVRSLLNFIPRALWAEKPPLTIGSTLRRVVFPNQTGGRPPGQAGVFYANFGALGIIIGGLALGVLLRSAYETFTEHATSPIAVLLYSVFVVEFVVIGGLNNGTIFSFLWHIIPIVLLLFVHWRFGKT